VERNARACLAPAVGEDMDLEAGVCRRPDRQLGREILRAPTNPNLGMTTAILCLFTCIPTRQLTGRLAPGCLPEFSTLH
jgi:hypothetical protein